MYQKIVASALVFLIGISISPKAFAGESQKAGPSVSAESAVVMNADSGELLYVKNEDEKRAMASTTKIMTALLALEYAQKDDKEIAVTDQMVRVEGSSMGLQAGDKLTLKNVVGGLLAVSGNDAANTVAIAMDGSQEAFAERMNRRAAELGMKNTHFVTPSGLDDEAHYTTARDMAILARAALENPEFAEIVSQRSRTVEFLSPQKTVRYTNHNKLLSQYSGCIGVKTGFTKKAGRCLVSAAERDGMRVICVTLHDPDDWLDHKNLLDYGFSLLSSFPVDDSAGVWQVPVVGGTEASVSVRGQAGKPIVLRRDALPRVKRIVELPHFLYAPVSAEETIGRIRYELDGETLAEFPLKTSAGIEAPPVKKGAFEKLLDFFKGLIR